MSVRTRIEPSPSGSLHVGNAMTASFNWYWARKHGGAFILRIADTDETRVTAEGLRSALEDLRWLGLDWDEGPEVGGPHAPYFQSERFELYQEHADRLLASGVAYRCYCTTQELDALRDQQRAAKQPPGYDGRCRTLTAAQLAAYAAEGRPSVVRFAMPEGDTHVTDLVRGEMVFEHRLITDFVIQRADGSPLYQLACSVDDMIMGLTHVIRGEDIVANTPKQIALMRALGHEAIPAYAHVPLIVGGDRTPLSKRHGDTSVIAYREHGYLPEVLLNYLAILNWSVGDGATETFTIPELIDAFQLSGVTRSPSAFDPQKLLAMNADRIRSLTPAQFMSSIAARVTADVFGGVEPTPEQLEMLAAIAPLVQERTRTLAEVPEQVRFLFERIEPDEKASAQLTPATAEHLRAIRGIVAAREPFEHEPLGEELLAWADAAGVKRKAAFQPLRAAICGRLVSPPLFESMALLGREECLARIDAAVARI